MGCIISLWLEVFIKEIIWFEILWFFCSLIVVFLRMVIVLGRFIRLVVRLIFIFLGLVFFGKFKIVSIFSFIEWNI